MIHRNVLTRKADEDGVSATTVERDYVLAHVLTAISKRDAPGQIIFKGGTALRLCHFESYRYSADLDFSLVGGLSADDAREVVAAALADCRERVAFPTLCLSDASPPRIEYIGPLASSRPRTLKLDLADDELVEETTTLSIVSRYPDQESCDCPVYPLEEVAAEKLRCVIQRLQCRDLYDLNELLGNRDVDVGAVWPRFERKARHRGVDPARFPVRFAEREPEWKRRWDAELSEYVTGELPPYDEVVRVVRRKLRFAFQ